MKRPERVINKASERARPASKSLRLIIISVFDVETIVFGD